MKEGAIIKLKRSILVLSDTTGWLMRITKIDEYSIEAKPVGDGWDELDLAIDWYYVPKQWIDHTYKHKEDEP